MPLRDATDYQFATATRRLLVRQSPAGPDVDLAEAARRHAQQLGTVLGATQVQTSPLSTTAHSATVLTITATLPADASAADPNARVVRTAFLRFPNGPLVEITLQAPVTDTAAEAEFQRLLASVRPSSADPLAAVAQSLAAGPAGRVDHPIGAIRIDLTPDYQGPTRFLLSSTDGAESFHLEREAAGEAATRAAGVGTLLSAGVGVARSEDGKPVRYEAGIRPRLSPQWRAATPPAAESAEVVRGPDGTSAVAGPGQAIVTGSVRGTPVRIRVSARNHDRAPAELGEMLLRDLNREDRR
jgi:hypothetical protein